MTIIAAPFLDNRDEVTAMAAIKACPVHESPLPVLLLIVSVIVILVYKKYTINIFTGFRTKIIKIFVWGLFSASILIFIGYLVYVAFIRVTPTYSGYFDASCGEIITCEEQNPCRGYMIPL